MADRLQAGHQLLAYLRDVGEQPVALDHLEHGQGRGACDRVAAEGGTVITLGEAGAAGAQSDAGPDREAAAQPLGQGQHIGPDALGLVREPGAGPADGALDLIEDEQRAGLVTGGASGAQVARGEGHHAAFAQGGLEEDGRHIGVDRGGQGGGVTERDEPHGQAEGTERLADGGLAGQRERSHRPAVEAAPDRYEHRPPRSLAAPHELDRRLVGLGPRVSEEHPPVPPEERQQAFGEVDLALVQEEVGGMGHLGDLPTDRLDDRRRGGPERAHRDPGDQVQVLTPVRVPHQAARTAADRDRGHAVVRHEGGSEPFLQSLGFTHGWTPSSGSAGITMVPMPESVKISSRMAWLRRPSRTWACGTPPCTAVRHASILGIIPAESPGSISSSSGAVSWLITSADDGQSRYSPATSVSTTSLAAPSATARAAAAVSAFTL